MRACPPPCCNTLSYPAPSTLPSPYSAPILATSSASSASSTTSSWATSLTTSPKPSSSHSSNHTARNSEPPQHGHPHTLLRHLRSPLPPGNSTMSKTTRSSYASHSLPPLSHANVHRGTLSEVIVSHTRAKPDNISAIRQTP